jgi:hypothetical protein
MFRLRRDPAGGNNMHWRSSDATTLAYQTVWGSYSSRLFITIELGLSVKEVSVLTSCSFSSRSSAIQRHGLDTISFVAQP